MKFKSDFIHNNDLKLNYLQSAEWDENLTPIVYIPGTAGTADDAIPLFECLSRSNRRCISLSLRGRGKSDTPNTGYSLHDNATDIDALVSSLNLKNYCLMGTSIGVIYSIIHLSKQKTNALSCILVDHPPKCTKLPQGWYKWFQNLDIKGVDILKNIRRKAIFETEKDAYTLDLTKEFSQLNLPTLALAAHKKEIFPILTKDEIEYFNGIPNCEVIHFYNSSHLIRFCEPEKYYGAINDFLVKFD